MPTIGLVRFGVFDFYFAREPITHPGLLSNQNMIVYYIWTTLNGAIFWTTVYFMRKSTYLALEDDKTDEAMI
jgi:hypothetical protein